MDLEILVCTHKKSDFAKDRLYYPIQLGVDEYDFDLNIGKDNSGDNISFKHRFYSEFSGLYWAWKNTKKDYLGICHYRRYFLGHKKDLTEKKQFQTVLTYSELENLIAKYPNKIFTARHRNYLIETIYSHYCHTHNKKDLDLSIEVMKEYFPSYYSTYLRVLNGKKAHMFNAFIMPWDKLDSYCSFLFDFLFEYEKKMDVTGYNEYESRLCGYIGELMLEVWIQKNDIKYKEIKYRFIGQKHPFVKAWRFLKHKFSKKSRPF
jgi:hypothetical protein